MGYLGLGSRKVVAAADTTGLNIGNLTMAFTQDLIGIKIPWFELYHVAIINVPSNTVVRLYEGVQLYTVAQLDTIGDWDPGQPMLLQPGQDINLCMSSPVGTTPLPVATLWFRYDTSLAFNPEGTR